MGFVKLFKIVSSIDTAEKVIRVNEKLTENVVKNCMLQCETASMWKTQKIGMEDVSRIKYLINMFQIFGKTCFLFVQ